MSVRILIADDHAVVRQGLRMFLSTQGEFEVVGEAVNGEEAVRLAGELTPDVVLMDLLMPVLDGVAAIARIRATHPGIEVVALTSVLDDATITSAIKAGAIGYLLKNTEGADLRRAVRSAAAGQVQLSPEVATRLAAGLRPAQPREHLTEREADVLKLVAQGLGNREIATSLAIAERTVKTHVSNIMAKLGVQSRTQAALHGAGAGLIERGDA